MNRKSVKTQMIISKKSVSQSDEQSINLMFLESITIVVTVSLRISYA